MSETNLKPWHENTIYLEDISKLGTIVKQLELESLNFQVDVNGKDRRNQDSHIVKDIIVITIIAVWYIMFLIRIFVLVCFCFKSLFSRQE